MPTPTSVDKLLTLARPDDWHLHLRDGPAMAAVLAATATVFGRAIVMPNLRPPVTTTALAGEYRQRILDALPAGSAFSPLMTLYLTDNTRPAEIATAKASGFVHAIKYYPAGATTHSDAGVTALERVYPALEAMQEQGVVLSVHGEVTDPDVDVFDRERVFIERSLTKIVRDFPGLRIVLEHITTAEAAAFVAAAPPRVAATITPQHLLYSRNALLRRRRAPAPLLPADPEARTASRSAARMPRPAATRNFSSAPIPRRMRSTPRKMRAAARAAIPRPSRSALYAEAFESAGALDRLEGFASHFGADFYGLPRHGDKVTLKREPWIVPDAYPFGEHRVVPLRAGETVSWRVEPQPQ